MENSEVRILGLEHKIGSLADYVETELVDLEKDEMSNETKLGNENESIEVAFSVHLILKKILNFLPNKDLLNCSLVSHLWNSKAYSVLRNNRRCLAKISSCQALKDFYSFVESVPNENKLSLPFNGLSFVDVDPDQSECHSSSSENNNSSVKIPFAENILNLIHVKYLHLDTDVSNFKYPAISIILSILAKFSRSKVLEGLSIGRRLEGLWSLPSLEDEDDSDLFMSSSERLPYLTTLQLPSKHYFLSWNAVNDYFIRDILIHAPNLKEITGEVEPELLEFILTKSKVACSSVKEFVFEPTLVLGAHGYQLLSGESLLQLCCQFGENQPKLRKLHITSKLLAYYTPVLENDLDKVAQVAVLLLQSNRDSLEHLIIAQRDLIYLHKFFNYWQGQSKSMQHDCDLVFCKLNSLTLIYTESLDAREGFSTLSKINLASKFPNLQTLKLYHTVSSYSETQYFVTNEFREIKSEFVCPSVTTLYFGSYDRTKIDHEVPSSATLIYSTPVTELIRRFAKLFPNVKHFVNESCFQFDEYCSGIFGAAWPDLETLTFKSVKFYGGGQIPNFDSCFTGIEDVKRCELLFKSKCYSRYQEFLSSSLPSIRNLTKLKLLRIKFEHRPEKCQKIRKDISTGECSPCLSEVTGFCAFNQMPDLRVEIARNTCVQNKIEDALQPTCDLELRDLQPFVKILSSNPDWAKVCKEF